MKANASTTRARRAPGAPRARGIVLLEVVVALAAFFTLGGIIVGSMDAAVGAARQVKDDARATDLAVTIMSQVRMGLLEPEDTGPEYCDEPLEDWSWEIVTETVSDDPLAPEMKRVEVVVRKIEGDHTRRLTELVPADGGRTAAGEAWR